MKLLQAVSLFTLFASAISAQAAQGDWLIEAAPHAVIWDERYDLGVGGQLGVIRGLSERTDISVSVQYAHFTPENPEVNNTVNSFGGLVTYFFSPEIEGFTPKVGVHMGYTTFNNPLISGPANGEEPRLHNFEFGGDGQLVFDVGERLKFYTMMSPAYLIGTESGIIFRIGLGLQYRVTP